MKLHLLEQGIDEFLTGSLTGPDGDWVWLHSMVTIFHRHWRSPDAASLADMYDECLQSRHTQRWWKRDHYRPKEIMTMLITADAELATLAWKDLANESLALDGRIDRFGYYGQDILDTLRKRDLRIADTHHHQDAAVISLYLAGMYPDKYVLYPGLSAFQAFCRRVESPSVPKVDDLPRYMKIALIVSNFLGKNPKFDQLCERRRTGPDAADFRPMQTAFEAISWLGGRALRDY